MPMQPGEPLVVIVDDVPENMQIAMSHLKELDGDFAYATSGEVSGDMQHVVGYAGVLIS
mgnify:CR=1 FL=1